MCIRQLGRIDTIELPSSYMNTCHKHATWPEDQYRQHSEHKLKC